MRLLVLGASGLLGAAVAAAARSRHTVIGVVGRFTGELPGLSERVACDLADAAESEQLVRRVQPDAIINCAALSEPAKCELEPERSEALNVTLPTILARVAAELGRRLIHVSSEQVFDGRRTTPYSITDVVAPLNHYGWQKLASEQAVRAAAGRHAAVVRAPLLLGNSPGGRRSMHEHLLADWAAGKPARLFVDEFRQPCTAANLAQVLLALAETDRLTGLFHWAGAELVSRLELGVRIRERFGLGEREAPIVPLHRADLPAVAERRQPCLAIDPAPLPRELEMQPPSLAEQLATLCLPAGCTLGTQH